MTQKGLGKGIKALLEDFDLTDESKVIKISIDRIKPNPNQPRKHIKEETLKELAESIKQKGIIQGGLGVAAGANINPNGVSMFEPMGGSAPKYAGKNVITPIAAIEAGRLMLWFLGEEEAAKAIQDAVKKTVKI